MNRSAPSFSRSLGCSIIPLLVAGLAHAHGGQYRGPGGIVPPGNSTSPSTSNNQTSGSTVPGNNSPAAPSSSGGGRAGAGGSAKGAGASSATPRGYLVGDDLGRWEYWWEFGKDPYLRLRDSVYSDRGEDPLARWNPRLANLKRRAQPPSPTDVQGVARQLAQLLTKTEDRDTASSCLVALAKIGSERAGFELRDRITPLLTSGDQQNEFTKRTHQTASQSKLAQRIHQTS